MIELGLSWVRPQAGFTAWGFFLSLDYSEKLSDAMRIGEKMEIRLLQAHRIFSGNPECMERDRKIVPGEK